jgi:hypothetical protein
MPCCGIGFVTACKSGSCDELATKMVILHERLADGRVLDITAWVCDRHYRAFAESGADDISF